jgi:chromosome segregation and condensation protein ScpB
MTSSRISVTRLRHLQSSTIASLLKKGLVYDTGRKRWCRKCRTFEIVLALTPTGMAERELADMLTADGRRLTRQDALNEVRKPFRL